MTPSSEDVVLTEDHMEDAFRYIMYGNMPEDKSMRIGRSSLYVNDTMTKSTGDNGNHWLRESPSVEQRKRSLANIRESTGTKLEGLYNYYKY